MRTTLFFFCLLLCVSPDMKGQDYPSSRQKLSLAGSWQSSLGPCKLPGTTDENRLGDGKHPTNVTIQLTRLYPFAGAVIYERDVVIPPSFLHKRLRLMMERTKPSTLWIDGDSIGSLGHIYAPHCYELPALVPGKHHIAIRIDNSPGAVPEGIHSSHAWIDATQTNWNGILGGFSIEAYDSTYIGSVDVHPSVATKSAAVSVTIYANKSMTGKLLLEGYAWNTPDSQKLLPVQQQIRLQKGLNKMVVVLDMGPHPLLWSEFHPALYKLKVALTATAGKMRDDQVVDFGMREFSIRGTQLVLNGNVIFLRGKHDGCVFPLTGYAPMDVDSWRKVFRIAKEYGINHYRCHSYTPPAAAFRAADIEGIYLQVELPFWGSVSRANTPLNSFLKREGDMILRQVGNDPSFILLSLGNELTGDISLMREWVNDFRAQDDRHLYCFGSNNYLGWKGPQDGEDVFVTCRVGGGKDYSSNVRASFSFADEDKGGILNNTRPNTVANYSGAIAVCPRPVIGHEICQFQIYPAYDQIKKYTGVLYPYNLEIFRDRLRENGLSDQAEVFHRATGHFAIECYKADLEYALRTPGFGGFQMLDLQDYPGQGSALVGILDAFMDSKGIVDPATFRGFCAPVVPLAMMKDYCWKSSQQLQVDLGLCNYEEHDWATPVEWKLVSDDGLWQRNGSIAATVGQGHMTTVGAIDLPLSDIHTAQRLTLTLTTGKYHNHYHLWVYPDAVEAAGDVYTTSRLDAELKKRLDNGERVLFVPDHDSVRGQTIDGMFTPDYWNYAMFKTISENNHREVSPGSLSVLCNPAQPLFQYFPTAEQSDWQWWSITRNSRPMILDHTRAAYKPLVQVVDNIERNHKLGLIFEFAVGKGRLLVCMADLEAIKGTPEGNQLRTALLRYVRSDAFAPTEVLDWDGLTGLFRGTVWQRVINGVKNQSDYGH